MNEILCFVGHSDTKTQNGVCDIQSPLAYYILQSILFVVVFLKNCGDYFMLKGCILQAFVHCMHFFFVWPCLQFGWKKELTSKEFLNAMFQFVAQLWL